MLSRAIRCMANLSVFDRLSALLYVSPLPHARRGKIELKLFDSIPQWECGFGPSRPEPNAKFGTSLQKALTYPTS